MADLIIAATATQGVPPPPVIIQKGTITDFAAGENVTESVQVAGDCFGVLTTFDVSQFTDPAVMVQQIVELSTDGGLTWELGVAVARQGGTFKDPFTGLPITTCDAQCAFFNPSYDKNGKFVAPVPKWKNPLIRTRVIISGAAKLTTAVDYIGLPVSAIPVQPDIPDKHFSIATVQFVAAQAGLATSITTGSITTTSTNLVIADSISGVGATQTITDSKSNTWVNRVVKTSIGAVNHTAFVEYSVSSVTGGSSHTFTATTPGNDFNTIFVTEISGQAASPFDVEAHSNAVSGASPHTLASTATTAQAASLIHGLGVSDIGLSFETYSVAAPWTQGNNLADSAAPVKWGGITADQVVSSTGTYAFVFSTSTTNDTYGGCTSVWKEAVAAAVNVAVRGSNLLSMGVG